jgi:NADH-quinone oxidoreductase subunit C
MESKDIFEKLKGEFGDSIIEFVTDEVSDPFAVVSRDNLVDICLYLRDNSDLKFDYLVFLSGMDYKDKLAVVYHLYSMDHKHRFVMKVYVTTDEPNLPSIERVWKTANWHEREAWDMYGIVFDGHPNHIRILTPYDWEGHPLRKDYVTPQTYHDIKVPY